jgi:NTP pyrophosphatase (non-canonical NTP hydrolase)
MDQIEIMHNYRMFTRSVAVYPRERGVLYCVLGLQSEMSELLEKMFEETTIRGITGEWGDILWYIVRLSDELGIYIESYFPMKNVIHKKTIDDDICKNLCVTETAKLEIAIGKLYDILKKEVRGDKIAGKLVLTEHIGNILKAFETMIATYGFSIEEIVEGNTTKLSSRKERNVVHGDGDNR